MKESTFQRAFRFLLVVFTAMTINRYLEYSYFSENDWYPFKHFVKYEIVQFVLALLIVSPFLFLKRKFRIYQLCLIPFWIYLGLEFCHVYLFHGFPNSATYFTIFTTNSNESLEFIDVYFTWSLFFFLLLYAAFIWSIGFFSRNLMKQHPKEIKIAFITATSLGLSIFGYAKLTDRLSPIGFTDNGFIQTFVQYGQYKEDQQKFIEIANKTITFEKLERKLPHNSIETHVIIIGESTSKHHMGLYGYARETNPLLSKEELIIFDNAKSPHAHTVPALEKVLTFKNAKNNQLGIEHGSIIDIVNQAGYETYWMSNQAYSGEHETPISVMASKADFKTYTNAIGKKSTLDEVIQEPFKKALKSKKSKVIFVHLMGTHLDYKERYPSQFNVFKDSYNLANMHWDESQQEYINAYDNAILYNDKIIADLLNELKKMDGECSFTYFSDHGDEVYDYRNFHGHSDVLLSKYMYDIPLISWFNEEYKSTHSEQMTFMIYNGLGHFNTENLIHYWSDVLDVFTEYYQSDLSPMSFDYENDTTIKAIPILKTSTKNDLQFSNKIWCHRVNSIERLKEAKQYFTGFEIDVVYQKEGWFDVNHPPAESIGLQLKHLIKSTLQPTKYFYWLDMKNLDLKNSSVAAQQLFQSTNEMHCTENIIVESSCLECLTYFDSLGFKTAYYLPFLHDMNEKELAINLNKIEKSLLNFSPSVLSQERDGFALVKKHFPNCEIISWDLQTEVTETANFNKSKAWALGEEKLKVLLVRFDSPSHR